MRLLLDSHTFLWFLSDDSRLSGRALREIASAEIAYVSVATLWELALKHQLGKLTLASPPSQLFPQPISENSMSVLDIKQSHVFEAASLPFSSGHKDPFDRLLVAQSRIESLPLVSADKDLDALS